MRKLMPKLTPKLRQALITRPISRSTWGTILVAAALMALTGASLLESFGLTPPGVGPVSFVGALVALKLGLFTFWPEVSRKGRGAGVVLRGIFTTDEPEVARREEKELFALNAKGKRPGSLSLWDQHDPRLDVSLFSASVPTFVLSQDQRFLDWNPAFELAFSDLEGVRRGAHVSHWFKHLDNFRRVPKRTDKLYGEGILPITDRERVAFVSKTFGRMVFTKIMSPIVDRGSGRIIGWTVVLNINSVNKRNEFFEQLFANISAETKRIRYASSYDGLFEGFGARDALLAAHREEIADAIRILEIGAGTGLMTLALLEDGRRVTAVEGDVHQLRRLKDKCDGFGSRVRLVRQNPDALKGVPEARFDAAVMCESLHRFHEPAAILAKVYESLKPGAILSISVRLDGVESLFQDLKAHLEATDRFDHLKHQFNHVLEHEREQASSAPYRFSSRDEVRQLILAAGFSIESESTGLQNGHTVLLKARK